MNRIVAEWRFELVAFLISPIIFYAIHKAGRAAKEVFRFAYDWLLWQFSRHTIKSLATRFSMRHYCRNQLSSDSTKFLQVPGSRGLPLNVDQVFVPLTIEYGSHPPESYKNLELLNESNRLAVVGDPGSGKSSLIKYLYRESCRKAEQAPAKSRLPIQVELRKIQVIDERDEQKAAQWLLAELRRQVAAIEGYDMGQLFDSCLISTGLLLLLDGLDEVAGDDFRTMSAALQGLSKLLAAKSENNAIVLTMRIQYYQQVQDQLIDNYPQVAYLRPFKPSEIYTFLTRWPFNKDSERNISRIYADLTDRPTLRAMCSNPLVLAMYVANDQTLAPGEVPESRTEFYRSVVDELLVLRRRRQDLVRGPSRALREQREEILGELAYENLVDVAQPANSLAWANALEIAMKVWKVSEAEAEVRFRLLENETGIIAEERLSESFQFIHLTFCEFLAAVECASNQMRWQDLLETHRIFALSSESSLASRLIEVIPFALALMVRTERPGALSEIATLGDREVLGRCFLETQLYDRKEWSSYVTAETKYLTNEGQARRDEGWLRRLQLFSVVLRDARNWMDQVAGRHIGPELDGLLPDIVGSNREALEEIFSLYASQDAPAALRLAESVGVNMLEDYRGIIVSSCQEPPFLALAMERAWNGSANSHTWLTILAEAALLYGNVAHKLEKTQIADTVPGTQMPVRAPIFVRRMKARSCYRDCLAFSLSFPPAALHPEFHAVAILSNLPTPSWLQKMTSSYFGIVIFLVATIALIFTGGPAVAYGSSEKSVAFLAAGLLLLAIALSLYILAILEIFLISYYAMLAGALINTQTDVTKPEETEEPRRPRSVSYLGRWLGNITSRSEQFALYQIAVLRGGIEVSPVRRRSGRAYTDGDLLPPRNLRLWSGES
jgi:NACHT domain-containing protein